jgi:hypothetical protein
MTTGNVVQQGEVMTLEEAAQFLRVSRSTLYQRPDIPRHRLPGSRQFRYLRSELICWLKGGCTPSNETDPEEATGEAVARLAPAPEPVYHRSALYR